MTDDAAARAQHFQSIAAQIRPQDEKGAKARNRMARHCVYKIFNECGDPLYVGMAANPDERLKQHARSSPFWRDGCYSQIEWAETRRAALNLEKATIKALRPKHNRIHNA